MIQKFLINTKYINKLFFKKYYSLFEYKSKLKYQQYMKNVLYDLILEQSLSHILCYIFFLFDITIIFFNIFLFI